jgi:HAD superfamily phosphoserine phosphatase-like hydrolase
MAEIAIYDMDRTITRHGTYTAFLIFWAWHRAPWRLLLLPLAALNGLAYAAGLITRKRVKELNQLLLMGRRVDRARLTPIVEAYARRVVEEGTYREAHAAIAADKAAGRRVVLATASHAFYVEPIARRLNMPEVIATGSVWDERGRLTWRIAGSNCYGSSKLDMG